ncbi:COP1-interactive protein 1-like [Hibiscus syriacus]|uniref:COP1-interactive protein 1-like n=1 Tax=Hibiscus syriacus TaxID=106335 RepID=UPI00192046AD|nr:COP1-interactive protein 1-like [Hibiscus syriacus]
MTLEDFHDVHKSEEMEQVEATKTDVEKKVERILTLIKRKSKGEEEPEIAVLVEDFHEQYQSLYSQYEQLKRESSKKVFDWQGLESHSSNASGSDSEYHPSTDIKPTADAEVNKHGSLQTRMTGNIQEELERALKEDADLNHQLVSKTRENEALASDHLAAVSKIQEIEIVNRDLRKEVDEKEKRLSDSESEHKGRLIELEENLIGLQNKVESHQLEKRHLEAQLDGKTAECKLHGETIKALYRQISEVGDEVSKFMKQIEDSDNNLTTKLEDSVAQIINLKVEVDNLYDQTYEVDALKQELDSVRNQKIESETLLERKSKETSQYWIQVKTLKDELARKSGAEKILVEEKEGLQMQVMELESEVDVLRKQKTKLEDSERSNIREINQLRDDKSRLNAKILELEALFQQKELEISAIQENYESKRLEETAQNMTLNAEIELLQQKLEFMKMEKSSLEERIVDQKRIMKQREDNANNTLESNSKLARRLSTGTNFNINVLERKMEDLAEEFRKKTEDNIRILYQRIMVAEKIHYDNKDTYKTIKEKLEQENEALTGKLKASDAELRKMRDSLEAGKKEWTESNSTLKQENGVLGKKLASCEAELKKLKDPTESMKIAVTGLNSRRDLENEVLTNKLANSEGELKKLRDSMEVGKDAFAESNSRLEQENGALKEKLVACEAELRKTRSSIKAGTNALAESNARLEQENRKLRRKLASCEADLRMLMDSTEASQNALTESNSRLEHANRELNEKLASCEADLRMLRDSTEASQNALTESNSRLEQAKRELNEKLATCEDELCKLKDSIDADALNESNSRLVQENEALGEKLASSEAELRKVRESNRELNEKLATCEAEVCKLKDSNESNSRLVQANETLTEKLVSSEAELRKARESSRELNEKLATCEDELCKLKDLNELNSRLVQVNEVLGEKLASSEAELRKVRESNRELNEKLATCEAELCKLKDLNESNSRLVQANEALGEKLASSEAEMRKVRESNRELNEKLATCEAELCKLKDSIESNSRLVQANEALGEKLASSEAELRKVRESAEVRENALTQSNSRLVLQIGELEEKLATCEAELSNLRDAMNESISSVDETSQTGISNVEDQLVSMNDMNTMLAEISKENELLKEKVSSLEAKLSEEEEEKLKLLEAITELETRVKALEKITKEKDEELLGREEEKRVAIRELCQLIDYHRCRYDELKEMININTVITMKKHETCHIYFKR